MAYLNFQKNLYFLIASLTKQKIFHGCFTILNSKIVKYLLIQDLITKIHKDVQCKNFIDPVKILKDNNITPESITDIIITHAHFDHIENIHRFPNARIIISLEEYNFFLIPEEILILKKAIR